MNKQLFKQILLIALSVLIILGLGLIVWVLVTENSRNEIRVYLEEGETELVEFEDLTFVPSDSFEYTVKLKGKNAKKYDLDLEFIKTADDDANTLMDYVYVRVISGNQIICDDLMVNVCDRSSIVLPVNFKEDKNTELTIQYYFPVNVGNEAKNAEAGFALKLTASKE